MARQAPGPLATAQDSDGDRLREVERKLDRLLQVLEPSAADRRADTPKLPSHDQLKGQPKGVDRQLAKPSSDSAAGKQAADSAADKRAADSADDARLHDYAARRLFDRNTGANSDVLSQRIDALERKFEDLQRRLERLEHRVTDKNDFFEAKPK
jgi:hypothetical protein